MKETLKRISHLRFALLPQRMVFPRPLLTYHRQLQASQWWSRDQLLDFQWHKVTELLHLAHRHSPFWRTRFAELGLEPGDIKDFDAYRTIPPITKNDVRDHLEEMKVDHLDQLRPILTHTGGTTGAPLRLYRTQATAAMRQAVEWRTYEMAGYHYRDLKIYATSGSGLAESRETWYEDPRYRIIAVNTLRADVDCMHFFCDLVRKRKPVLFTGNVEFYRVLGKFLERRGIDDIRVRAIFSQGESLTQADRDNLHQWFGARVFDYYGMRENAVSASECDEGAMHINSEFAYMEFENDGRPAEPDTQAEIIGTSLVNHAIPLIRYRTGDYGQHHLYDCPCGRHLPVMSITGGRARDFITTRSKLIYICHQVAYLLEISREVEAIQFYQPNLDELTIRLQTSDTFDPSDAEKLVNATRKIVEDELAVSVERVATIPRTRLGKYRYVISEVDPVL